MMWDAAACSSLASETLIARGGTPRTTAAATTAAAATALTPPPAPTPLLSSSPPALPCLPGSGCSPPAPCAASWEGGSRGEIGWEGREEEEGGKGGGRQCFTSHLAP